eukprot:6289067-Prymnesium_polylepis.1
MPAGDEPAFAPFLDDNDLLKYLPHLMELTVDDFNRMVLQEKPQNMAELKSLGMDKLPERQKVANALAKERRRVVGHGMPCIVFLYSTGLTPPTAEMMLREMTEWAANGPCIEKAGARAGEHGRVCYSRNETCKTLLLDHFTSAPYCEMGLRTWDEYIEELVKTIDAEVSGERLANACAMLVASHCRVRAVNMGTHCSYPATAASVSRERARTARILPSHPIGMRH